MARALPVTTRRSRTLSELLLILAFVSSSCAARHRSPVLMGQPVTQPVAVWVRVSNKANDQDDLGGTSTLVETLVDELTDRGVSTRLFLAESDSPPGPRIEVLVEEWDVGDREARGFAPIITPVSVSSSGVDVGLYGKYSVLVSVLREGEFDPIYVRRYQGRISGSADTTSMKLGESLANSIVRETVQNGPSSAQPPDSGFDGY